VKNIDQMPYFILLAYVWMSCLHLTYPDYGNVHIYHNETTALSSKQNWEEEEGVVCWRDCWLHLLVAKAERKEEKERMEQKQNKVK